MNFSAACEMVQVELRKPQRHGHFPCGTLATPLDQSAGGAEVFRTTDSSSPRRLNAANQGETARRECMKKVLYLLLAMVCVFSGSQIANGQAASAPAASAPTA